VEIEPTATPDRPARQDWKEDFRAAGSPADDALLLDAVPQNAFDADEWTW